MFAQHGIQNASVGRKEFIVLNFPGVPLAIRGFKDCLQAIGHRLIRTEDAKIALVLIELFHVAQEFSQYARVLGIDGPRCRHAYSMGVEVRHAQITQQKAAIGVRICAHPPIACRRQFGQFRQ